MALSYNKLFVLMKEKGITTYVIRKENIISQRVSFILMIPSLKGITIFSVKRYTLSASHFCNNHIFLFTIQNKSISSSSCFILPVFASSLVLH